jgi:hypothetical protein
MSAGPYAAVLDGLAGWLGRAGRVFPGVARDSADLLARLAEVREMGGRLEAPLFLLIAGGTGAGKSTLLNALAGGEPIAETSPVRPTTTALTCYFHVANDLAIAGDLLAEARAVPHERAALRDKVILDAPDFDSTVRANEALFRRALAAADLVVVVATPEKYADADLFRILEEQRRGRAFVFVLNRLDRGVPREVADDFRRELARAGFARPALLVISALAAFRSKRGDPEPGPVGDFPRLEALIERELTRARVREIKRLNLDVLVARLFERAEARVPADLAARVQRWRAAANAIAAEAEAHVGLGLARAVLANDALAREVHGRVATAYGGPFGVYQALHWGVRSLGGRGFAGLALAAELGLAPLDPREEEDESAPPAVLLAARRIDDVATEVGLAPPERPLAPEDARRLVGRARAAGRAAIAAALAEARDPARRGVGRRIASFLCNAPPLAVLGYALARWGLAFARGELLSASWFIAAGLVALSLLALAGAVVDAAARRTAARVVASLAAAAREAAAREVARPLLARLSASIGEVEAAAKALADLEAEARVAAAAHERAAVGDRPIEVSLSADPDAAALAERES